MDRAPAQTRATPTATVRVESVPTLAQPIGGGLSPAVQLAGLPLRAPNQTGLPDGLKTGVSTSTRSRPGIIQRVVNPADCDQSVNGHYLVPNVDRNVLYSRQDARNPVPASLYGRGDEATNTGVPLYVWRPNVRLFSNKEQAAAKSPSHRQVPSEGWCGLAGLLGFTQQGPDFDFGKEEAILAKVQKEMGDANKPTTGVMGKNDCREFAKLLQGLIATGADRPAPPALGVGIPAAAPAQVGDQLDHDDFAVRSKVAYHSATIVAADGASTVTLEANAGKNLQAPEFFIHAGLAGFMAANNETCDNGTKGDITRLAHQGADPQRLLRARLDPTTMRNGVGRSVADTVAIV